MIISVNKHHTATVTVTVVFTDMLVNPVVLMIVWPSLTSLFYFQVTQHLVESEGEYVNELKGFLQSYLKPLSTANM